MRTYRTLLPASVLAAAVLVAASHGAVADAAADTAPHERSALRTPAELKAAVMERASVLHRHLSSTSGGNALPPGGVGNGIFQVYLEQHPGLGVGTFTVLTGPANAAGPGRNVLFGDGVPGTSYLVVRDDLPDGSNVDYVQGQLLTHANEVSLDDYLPSVTALGDTGYRTTWLTFPFGTLSQDVVLHGSTQADSTVEVTTRLVPSAQAADHTFTFQFLWDVAMDTDDGPALQPQPPASGFRPFVPVVTNEATLADTDDSLAVVDNDANDATPTMAVGLTLGGPEGVTRAPTTPEATTFVCWPQAIYAPLGGYQPDSTLDISTPASSCEGPDGGNDSAVQQRWTMPGSEGPIAVSASLFMSPRTPYATAMTATPVVLHAPPFSSRLVDSAAGRPIPGRTVSFRVGGSVRCTAVTDANGVARCGTLGDALAAVAALGYTTAYPGNGIWAPASAAGGIL